MERSQRVGVATRGRAAGPAGGRRAQPVACAEAASQAQGARREGNKQTLPLPPPPPCNCCCSNAACHSRHAKQG